MARKISKKASHYIGAKIRRLRREKYPEKQAVAIAFAMARHRGFKVPKKPEDPPGVFRPHDHK